MQTWVLILTLITNSKAMSDAVALSMWYVGAVNATVGSALPVLRPGLLQRAGAPHLLGRLVGCLFHLWGRADEAKICRPSVGLRYQWRLSLF
jgi:hypothetical protein